MGIACAQAEKAGADYIHVDVIDGQFAPNLTVGPGVVNDIRPHTNLPLDVHLMVVEPGELIAPFVRSGADILTVHFEACANPLALVNQIKDDGARAGIAINPDNACETVNAGADVLAVGSAAFNSSRTIAESLSLFHDKLRLLSR